MGCMNQHTAHNAVSRKRKQFIRQCANGMPTEDLPTLHHIVIGRMKMIGRKFNIFFYRYTVVNGKNLIFGVECRG